VNVLEHPSLRAPPYGMASLHIDDAALWMAVCASRNGLCCLNGGSYSDSKEYNMAGLFPRAIGKPPVLVADPLSAEPLNIVSQGRSRWNGNRASWQKSSDVYYDLRMKSAKDR
jgi:hypothetical protein